MHRELNIRRPVKHGAREYPRTETHRNGQVGDRRWVTAVRKDVALWSTSNVQQTRRDVSEKGGKWGTTGKCGRIAGKKLSSKT